MTTSQPATRVLPDDLVAGWQARTTALPGGHVAWSGGQSRRTPTFRYHGHEYSAAKIAFILRWGVEPVGLVAAGCGMAGCIAPDHVDDTRRRQRDRAALRLVLGGAARAEVCVARHDQTVHGRLHGNGRAYCQACKTERKHTPA